MNENAKNQLLDLLRNLGCSEDCADFQPQAVSPSNSHCSTVVVKFPDGRIVRGIGEGRRITDADIAAAQIVLEQLRDNHPDLIVDWDEIKVEAQAGDALIKLAAYLSTNLKKASDKSNWLQQAESDPHLAEIFDQWKAQGDLDLAMWGSNLKKERKATLVEALLWRRFRKKVITTDAPAQLQSLIKLLDKGET